MTDLTKEKILGADAHGLVNNPAYKQAVKRMDAYLETKLLSCNPDSREETLRVVLTKQLFVGLQREFAKIIENGEVAMIQIEELEQLSKKDKFQRNYTS